MQGQVEAENACREPMPFPLECCVGGGAYKWSKKGPRIEVYPYIILYYQ